MAITRESLPFGLRDVKVGLLDPVSQLPTILVDLPNGQTLSFTDSEDFEELRGDDRVVAKRGMGGEVEWELESGGIKLEAYVIIAGGTLTMGGTGLMTWKKYRKRVGDSRPDFWAEGQSMSESGGDFHTVIPRCKADDSLEGTMEDGSFWVSSASGTGYASISPDPLWNEVLYEFTQNETATAITLPEETP